MKTQTPPRRSLRSAAVLLAVAAGALLLLPACHHGVYHQRYAHPHAQMAHAHFPDHYGPATKPGQTWHRKIKPGKRWPYHHHTTWHHLDHGPRNYRLRVAW